MRNINTTIFIDPASQGRGIRSLHNTDVLFEPHTGDPSLDNEGVVLTGNWTDYTGSGIVPKGQVILQGVTNTLDGTFAGVLGARFQPVNPLGQREVTHRLRQILNYNEFDILNKSK